MYYHAASRTPLTDLVSDCLVQAHNVKRERERENRLMSVLVFLQNDFDVFNALDLMDNKEFLEKLKFGVGDGNLQYYIYNWKCPLMNPDKVSMILFIRSSIFFSSRWHYYFNNRSSIETKLRQTKQKEKTQNIELCDFFISFSFLFFSRTFFQTRKNIVSTKIPFSECNDFPMRTTRNVVTRKERQTERN